MSDRSEGQDWWLASDGKWYPPQSRPATAAPPPLGAQRVDTNGMAVASLVLGIIGIMTFGVFVIPNILAVVFGHLSLSAINKSGGQEKGRGMAITGLVLGYVTVALVSLFILAIVVNY